MTQTVDVRTGVNSLDDERSSMSCSPAQMRLALFRAGLLDQVQSIVDSDAEAQIVWEYATIIQRQSPLISALRGGSFSNRQIDDIFRTAMQVSI